MSSAAIFVSATQKRRLEKLLDLCKTTGVDGVMILPGPNMTYLLDFTLEVFERPSFLLAVAGQTPLLVVPELDRERAEEAVGGLCQVLSYDDETGPWKIVDEHLSGLSGVLGVESKMPVGLLGKIQRRATKLRFDEIDHLIKSMRVVKDPSEIGRHKDAARILEQAMLITMNEIRAGMKEREVMSLFFKLCYDMGVEKGYCFVQSGPNGAKPHLEPTSKIIQENEVIVFDASVCYRGYYADFTRTIVLGKPTPEHEKIFNTVLDAQQRAIDSVRPGVSAEQLDRAARGRIAEEGYAEYFIHRTGHGLGVEVHEEPNIVEGNKAPLMPGMIFTIEPGIYLTGKFGVRLEDDIIVGHSGYENTTRLPKIFDRSML